MSPDKQRPAFNLSILLPEGKRIPDTLARVPEGKVTIDEMFEIIANAASNRWQDQLDKLGLGSVDHQKHQ